MFYLVPFLLCVCTFFSKMVQFLQKSKIYLINKLLLILFSIPAQQERTVKCLLVDHQNGTMMDNLKTLEIPIQDFDTHMKKILVEWNTYELQKAIALRQKSIEEGRIPATEDSEENKLIFAAILSDRVRLENLPKVFELSTFDIPKKNITIACFTKSGIRNILHILIENITLESYLCHAKYNSSRVEMKELYGSALVFSTDKCTHLGVEDFKREIKNVVTPMQNFDHRSEKKAKREQRNGRMPVNQDFLELKLRVCSFCGKSPPTGTKFQVCPCKHACYCNKVCQKKEWPQHKLICKSGSSKLGPEIEEIGDKGYYGTKVIAKAMALNGGDTFFEEFMNMKRAAAQLQL